jgi:hypothetical protein
VLEKLTRHYHQPFADQWDFVEYVPIPTPKVRNYAGRFRSEDLPAFTKFWADGVTLGKNEEAKPK